MKDIRLLIGLEVVVGKWVPNTIDICSIGLSLITKNPIYLCFLGNAEVFRFVIYNGCNREEFKEREEKIYKMRERIKELVREANEGEEWKMPIFGK